MVVLDNSRYRDIMNVSGFSDVFCKEFGNMATQDVGSPVVLVKEERLFVVRGLSTLSASLRRAANNKANSPEINALFSKDADQVDSLAAKFR